MTDLESPLTYHCVVLAGERPGGSPMAQAFAVPAGVLVPVAGKSCLSRVLEALGQTASVADGLVVGPAFDVVQASAELRQRLQADRFPWREPASGPAASALAGVDSVGEWPILITAGDHALLTPEIVEWFCVAAADENADVVVGLVPYTEVQAAYPESRRTVLRFSDRPCCGSNLFAMKSPRGRRALQFWTALEADRKKPWRIARKLGLSVAIRYLLRGLTVDQAFKEVSRKMGCTVRPVLVPYARAAVDVDSPADRELAEAILSDAGPAPQRSTRN